MKRRVTETLQFLGQWNRGDETGMEKLIERHLPWIRAHVHKRLGPRLRRKAETGDYVQDALVEFLRYGPRIEIADDDHFRALMVRIVENTLRGRVDWFNAQRRKVSRFFPIPSDTVLSLDPPRTPVERPSEAAGVREQTDWIRLGLELLDPEERDLIVQHQWEGRTFSEIGEEHGIAPDTIRMRHVRSVARLARKVADLRRGNLARAVGNDPS